MITHTQSSEFHLTVWYNYLVGKNDQQRESTMQIDITGQYIHLDAEALELITDEVANMHDETHSVRADYSGRGMHGATCVGVTSRTPGAALAFAQILMDEIREAEWGHTDIAFRVITHMMSDTMGLSMIYYWPNIRVV